MAAYDGLKHPLYALGPERHAAFFRFTPAASPALQVLTEGENQLTITRTAAGAWTLQLLAAGAKDIECFAACIENDGTTHMVRVSSQDEAAGTVALLHCGGGGPVVVPLVGMTDVAAATTAYGVSPVAGTITLLQTQLVSGGPLNAAAALTFSIDGTPITGGVVTIADTSAVGEIDSATPSAANTVAAGSAITALSDGGGSTTTAAAIQVLIQPAGSDTVDQIYGVVFYRVCA